MVSCSEGGRAYKLLKKREDSAMAAEAEKVNIENETKKRRFNSIDGRFGLASTAEQLEEEFKKQT
ncbi:unnamed protein product, partial [Polarella glacialis]